MTTLEQNHKLPTIFGMAAMDFAHLDEADWQKVQDYMFATYNARTQEVVEIAEGMRPKDLECKCGNYDVCDCGHEKYNQAISDLIQVLSPEVKDDSK